MMQPRNRTWHWIRHRANRMGAIVGIAFAVVTVANSSLHLDVWTLERDAWDQSNQQWFIVPFGIAIAGLAAALMTLATLNFVFRKQAALAKARRLVPVDVRHSAVGTLAARRKKEASPSPLYPGIATIAGAISAVACLLPEAGFYWARLLVYLWAGVGHVLIVLAVCLFVLIVWTARDDLWRKIKSWRNPKQGIPEQERAVLMARAASAGLDPDDPDLAQALLEDYSRQRKQALALERQLDCKTASAQGQATTLPRL